MSLNVRKQSWAVWIISGVIGLIALWWFILRKKKGIKEKIISILTSRGVSPRTAKYWAAISAFETAYPYSNNAKPWNSPVFKDTNNPFNLIVPGSKRLDRGEGQTIYATVEDGINALYDHVIRPFKYPLDAESLEALNRYQKKKGYFISGLDDYIAGSARWYDKLF